MRLPPKDWDLPHYEVDHESNPKRKLTAEAVIHRDINTQHPDVSPHLRGYKFIQDSGPGSGRYRFYLEYCPYGSIDHLIRLYRCWDTFLPETFIWHVFYHLANACEALRDCPLADSVYLKWGEIRGGPFHDVREDLYCLHMDMKPGNFLLGYPHQGEEYPSALLNDYGTSVYTDPLLGKGPYHNPEDLWWRGTHLYKPTVSNVLPRLPHQNLLSLMHIEEVLTSRCRNNHIMESIGKSHQLVAGLESMTRMRST